MYASALTSGTGTSAGRGQVLTDSARTRFAALLEEGSYRGAWTVFLVDAGNRVARPEFGSSGNPARDEPWLNLRVLSWESTQTWECGIAIPAVSPSASDAPAYVHAHVTVPLHYHGDVVAVLVLHGPSVPLASDVVTRLDEAAALWYCGQLLGELRIWHNRDAERLSLIAGCAEVLAEPQLELQLAKLLHLALAAAGAEVGCVCLRSEDAKLVPEVLLGVDDALADSLLNAFDLESWSASGTGSVQLFAGEDIHREGVPDALEQLMVARMHGATSPVGLVLLVNPAFVDDGTQALLATVTGLASAAVERSILHAAQLANAAVEEQMRIAGKIQRGLLPAEELKTGLVNLAATSDPCDEAGGDFYSYFTLPDGGQVCALGDATGHGVGAALLAATVRASLRALLLKGWSDGAAEIVCKLNNLTAEDCTDGVFVTLCIVVINPWTGECVCVNAGHDPPLYWLTGDNPEPTEISAHGPPLGVLADYPYTATEIRLAPGDRLLMLSDGVHECTNADGLMFGKHRVLELMDGALSLAPAELRDRLMQTQRAFRSNAPQTDDVTVLCAEYVGMPG